MPKPTVTLQEYQERKAKAKAEIKKIKIRHKQELLPYYAIIKNCSNKIGILKKM